MNIKTNEFKNVLEKVTYNAENYITYSPTQITRGDHLKNDPSLGEHAWSIPKTTGEFLYNLIKNFGPTKALELGTSIGYSTLWIAAGLDENSSDFTLLTIERNPEKQFLAKKTLDPQFSKNILFKNGEIIDYLKMLPENQTFDFIFMDADRGNYREYWNYIKKYIHKKSIIIIDNALRAQKSVSDFQDLLNNDPTLVTYLYNLDNGLFIVALSDGHHNDLYSIVSQLL